MARTGMKIAKGSTYIFLSMILVKGMGSINALVIIWLLGPGAVGIFTIVAYLAATISSLSDFGIGTAGVKKIAEYRAKDPSKVNSAITTFVGVRLILALPLIIGFFLFSGLIANEVYYDPRLTILMRLMAISMLIDVFSGIFLVLFQAYQKIETLAKFNTARGILNVVFVVSFIYLFKIFELGDLNGFFFAKAMLSAVLLVALVLAFYRPLRKKMSSVAFSVDRALAKSMLSFSIFLGISAFFVQLGFWYGSTILYRIGGPGSGDVQLGYFWIAYGLSSTVIMFIPWAVGVPLLPIITEHYQIGEERFDKTLYKSLKYLLLMVFPLAVSLAWFPLQIMSVPILDKAFEAAPLLLIIAPTAFMMTFFSGIALLFQASDSMKQWGIMGVAKFLSFVTCATILVPFFHENYPNSYFYSLYTRLNITMNIGAAVGLIISLLISYGVYTLAAYLSMYKKHRTPLFPRYCIYAEVGAILIFLIGFVGAHLDLPIRVLAYGIFIAIYLLALNFYVFNREDKDFIKMLFKSAKRKTL